MTIDYLKRHGIDDPSIARKYQLGFVDKVAPGDDPRFQGALSIPYLTKAGVVNIKYRCPFPQSSSHDCRKHGGKYMAAAGSGVRLYNVRAFFEADNEIGMTEGEIDAIAASERIGLPSLGMPGVEMWKAHGKVWKIALKDYDTVVYFADGDKAGIDTARAVTDDIGPKQARLVRCRTDEDVSSSVVKGLADELREKAGL